MKILYLKFFVYLFLAVLGWPLNFHFMFDLMLLSALVVFGLSFFLPKSIEHKRESPTPSLPTGPSDVETSALRIPVPPDDAEGDSEHLLVEGVMESESNDTKQQVVSSDTAVLNQNRLNFIHTIT